MTDNSPYMPLKESWLWSRAELNTVKDWKDYPTKLDYFASVFFTLGNSHEWSGGRLVNYHSDTDGVTPETEYDIAFDAAGVARDHMPETNPLYVLIPDIAQDQFLQRETIYPAGRGRHYNEMPLHVDVHYLAAIMMMLKHVYEYPTCLPDSTPQKEQLAVIRQSLNVGFAIIEQRGIEGDFAKSCAEFEQNMTALTSFPRKYLKVKKQEQARQAEIQRKLNEINEQVKALTDKPGKTAAKCPAPKL